MSKKMITEETDVQYTDRAQLSYADDDEPEIELYLDGMSLGWAKVWKDSEMDGREYICLNYEIIYLDTLKKIW